MATQTTAKNLFKPQVSKPESRAQATDRAFRGIVSAETKARNRKTERLRQARLRQAKESSGR